MLGQLDRLLQEAAPGGPRSYTEALQEPAAKAMGPGRGLSSAICQRWDLRGSSTFLYLICKMDIMQAYSLHGYEDEWSDDSSLNRPRT